jgi:hypothetical protein
MEQLWCVFGFETSDETRALGTARPFSPGASCWFRSATRYTLADWVHDVETSPTFVLASAGERRLLRFDVVQDAMD